MDTVGCWTVVVIIGLMGFITIEAKEEKIKNLQLEVEQYRFTAQVLQKQCQ